MYEKPKWGKKSVQGHTINLIEKLEIREKPRGLCQYCKVWGEKMEPNALGDENSVHYLTPGIWVSLRVWSGLIQQWETSERW